LKSIERAAKSNFTDHLKNEYYCNRHQLEDCQCRCLSVCPKH